MRCATIRRRSMPRRQRGFTLIDILIGVAIVGIGIALLLRYFGGGVRRVTTGRFTTSPATVSCSGTGTFVWTMTQTVGGAPASAIVNRATSFKVTPTAGVRIVSITDGAGQPIAVGNVSGSGSTDASGNVTVVIKIDYIGSATLTATDKASGSSETANFAGVP